MNDWINKWSLHGVMWLWATIRSNWAKWGCAMNRDICEWYPNPTPTLKSQSWNNFENVFKASCDNFHVILGPMLWEKSSAGQLSSQTPPSWIWATTPPPFFYKNIQTILRSGNSRRLSCHSWAVSKHSSNHPIFSVIRVGHKERSVWDCAWSVAGGAEQ